jgi:hypothetical protein
MLLMLALSQLSSDYQERQIYYNEDDNVCEHGSGHD